MTAPWRAGSSRRRPAGCRPRVREIGLRGGRNGEVRRVLEHLDYPVTRLIRLSYGPFQLGLLERGAVEEVPRKVLADQLGTGGGAAAEATQKRHAHHRR